MRPSLAAPILAYGLVLGSPLLAWLVWISGTTGKASDARHVAWFVTVAVACTVAGALVPRRTVYIAGLATVAVVSTLITLYWWWSAADVTGLFMVGIILAAPLVLAAAVPLLLLGSGISSVAGRLGRRGSD